MAILKEFDELVVTSRPGQAAGGVCTRCVKIRCAAWARMACTAWRTSSGAMPANPRVLICVHGLTRNGRDFDVLANALASDYRVVCPDIVGRGRSDRLFFPTTTACPSTPTTS
jgi:pimeloyl-ACP methyl ester carboxylesterase